MPRSSKRPRLTEAERDARRQADRERVEQAARALLTSDGWRRWIKVRAINGLSRYSLRNQLLIAIDCHHRGITPTYVAGFRSFLALNRCVRTGEKAIRILAKRALLRLMRCRSVAVSVLVVVARAGAWPCFAWSSCAVCERCRRGRLPICIGCATVASNANRVRAGDRC